MLNAYILYNIIWYRVAIGLQYNLFAFIYLGLYIHAYVYICYIQALI